MSLRFHTQGNCSWNNPRPQSGFTREYIHGRVQPMPQPGFFKRLVGRAK
jgi:hypothetical protein